MVRDANDLLREGGEDLLRQQFDRQAGGEYDVAREKTQNHPKKNIPFPLAKFRQFGAGLKAEYLVKGLVPRSGLYVVWGPPKCGKSFWTFDLAMHIALGRKYRGRRVHSGTVVYLALEGETGFRARRDAFAKRFLDSHDDPSLYLMTSQINLRSEAEALIKSIRSQLGANVPALVVIDTLNRSFVGSESKDEDMSSYIRAADRIRIEFGCTVLIVHHCGVSGDRPRGHTSLTGAVDGQLSVKKSDDEILVTVEYMKDGMPGEVISSRLEVVQLDADDDGDPITSCVIVPAEVSASSVRKPKMPASAKAAFAALIDAVNAVGEAPPANANIPDNIRAVTLEQWEHYFNQRSVSKSERVDSRRKAFKRAAEKLKECHAVGVWQPYVWPAWEQPP